MSTSADIDFLRRVSPRDQPEWMDGECSYHEFRACLRSLEQVNRWLLGYRPTLAWLERLPRERYELASEIGNPHAVLHVESVETAPVERIGRALQSNVHFPRQVNVGFMEVLDTSHIRLRVYERGVGETLACGTGACAAAVVGHHLGLLGTDVNVRVTGGTLSVHWGGPGQSVWLTGPAQRSFEGHVEI